jgi:phosphopantetheine adenylyltransferase
MYGMWRMVSSGLLRRVALVRTDVSEELSASIIKVKRIGETDTTLAVTSDRRSISSQRVSVASYSHRRENLKSYISVVSST